MSSPSEQHPHKVLAHSEENASEASGVVRATLHAIGYSYSGPLPPPGVLREFEEILPGSAERIFVQFEEQAKHRRVSESRIIASNMFNQNIGTLSASAIGLSGVIGGIWLVAHGQSITGLGTVFLALGSIVATFLYKRGVQDEERAANRPEPRSKGH